MNKFIKLFVLAVLAVVGLSYSVFLINSIHNPVYRLLGWSGLLIGSVFVLLICIDLLFSTKITEKVVAGLVTNILWAFMQFIGKIFVKSYAVTTMGILSLIKMVQRK